jgi:CO/xanthine dehydrogenase FAD-binding subunit
MKYGLDSPEVIVGLRGLPVRAPFPRDEGGLVVDALMSLTAVSASSLIRKTAPILAESAGLVAADEIRNAGTLGGNLCQDSRCLYYNQSHDFQFVEPCYKRGGENCYFIPKGKKCWAVYMSDTAPALMCLGAQLKIMGSGGFKMIPLEALYSSDPKKPLSLGPTEIVREVWLPAPPPNRREAFVKLTLRGALEFAALNVAAVLDLESDGGPCSEARIAVGAVSSAPVRARRAESVLAGKSLTPDLIWEVSKTVSEEVRIVPHHGFSGAYLTECLEVQVRRALSAAAEGTRER